MKRSRGFSVVELMIALTIIAVGAMAAAPLFTSLLEGSRLTTATNNIIEALATTRSEAVRRGQSVKLVPVDGDWKNGWAVQLSADDSELKRFDPLPNVVTVTTVDDIALVEYQRTGMRTLPAEDLVLTVCAQSAKGRQITLTISGSTSVNPDYEGCGI